MKVAICSFVFLLWLMLNLGWLHHTLWSRELLNQNHKTQDLDLETDPLQTITTMPTHDSSLAMELLMPVLLEQPQELLANMLQTRSSTPVQEVVPGSKIQTTEYLVEILETFFLELLQDLRVHQLLTLQVEVHVGDKIFNHMYIHTIPIG